MLMNRRAQSRRLASQRTPVIQRMKVEGAFVQNRLVIFGRNEELSHLITGQITELQSELAPLAFACSLQGSARVVTQYLRNAGYPMGILNPEFVDIAADDLHALHGEAEQLPCLIRSRTALDGGKPRGITCGNKAAVAAGGAPGHPLGFEQHDLTSAACKLQSRCQTGQSTTDDADIRLDAPRRPRIGFRRGGGAAVIGVDIGGL